jgi:hypothetical protein
MVPGDVDKVFLSHIHSIMRTTSICSPTRPSTSAGPTGNMCGTRRRTTCSSPGGSTSSSRKTSWSF